MPGFFARRGGVHCVAVCAALLAASCGGGDSSSPTPSPAPTPSNGVPSFTSADSVSVAENTEGAIYTPAASDPDGDPVTIAIGGGADADMFTLADGVLSFKEAPNFDRPADANTDNRYRVNLSATDGRGGTGSLALTVTVTNDREGVYPSKVADFGAGAIISGKYNDSGVIRVTRSGEIGWFDRAHDRIIEFGNVFLEGESGRPMAVAEYNSLVVVMLEIEGRGIVLRTIVTPFSSFRPGKTIDLAPATVQEQRGSLQKSVDGYLTAAVGDLSGDFAQDANSGLGKLFLVLFNLSCGIYASDYCFDARVIGSGLRAPVGFSRNASILLIDRGAEIDEINLFRSTFLPDEPLVNFGWPFFEGDAERMADPPSPLLAPLLTFPHGDGFLEGHGLTGSVDYLGQVSSLYGAVILSDESGKIFTFNGSVFHTDPQPFELENRTADFVPMSGALEMPVDFEMDYNGRLFVLDADGELYEI